MQPMTSASSFWDPTRGVHLEQCFLSHTVADKNRNNKPSCFIALFHSQSTFTSFYLIKPPLQQTCAVSLPTCYRWWDWSQRDKAPCLLRAEQTTWGFQFWPIALSTGYIRPPPSHDILDGAHIWFSWSDGRAEAGSDVLSQLAPKWEDQNSNSVLFNSQADHSFKFTALLLSWKAWIISCVYHALLTLAPTRAFN